MPSMLIVDDDFHLRKLVLTYAQMENYQCREAENERMVFTRKQLLDKVWIFDYFGDARTVDTHIKALREHLGPYRKLIETVLSARPPTANCSLSTAAASSPAPWKSWGRPSSGWMSCEKRSSPMSPTSLYSPLALIGGYAEIVRDITWKDDAQREENLNLIISEANRMSVMVSNILDYSLLQSGCLQLNRGTHDLCEIVESEVHRCEQSAQENHLALSFDGPGEELNVDVRNWRQPVRPREQPDQSSVGRRPVPDRRFPHCDGQ